MAAVERILRCCFPGMPVELRDRGLHYQLGQWAAAMYFGAYLAKGSQR